MFLLLFPSLRDKSLSLAPAHPCEAWLAPHLSKHQPFSFLLMLNNKPSPMHQPKAAVVDFIPMNIATIYKKRSLLWPAAIGWVAFFMACSDLRVCLFSPLFALQSDNLQCSFQLHTRSLLGVMITCPSQRMAAHPGDWAEVVPQSQLLTCYCTGLFSYSLSFRASSRRIYATLCGTELLQGRDGQIPNLYLNVFKTLKVLRCNSLA